MAIKLYTMRPHILHATKVGSGIEVYNWSTGKVDRTSKSSPFIITGTRGEQWVVSMKDLMQRYTLVDGTPISDDLPSWQFCITPILSDTVFYARQVAVETQMTLKTLLGKVTTNANSCIPHGKGDFIVYALNELGIPNMYGIIVNGMIFHDIYKEIGSTDGRMVIPYPSHYSTLMEKNRRQQMDAENRYLSIV